MASFVGLIYQGFGWTARALTRLLYAGKISRLKENLEAAEIRMYPEAYLSVVGFLFILSIVATVVAVWLTKIFLLAAAPVVVLLLGYALPIIRARDRAARLDMEAPFMAAYVSVMATGGLSPYVSIKRLKNCELLPHTSKNARRIEVDVQLKGVDPVTAIERSAGQTPSREYRDFLTGYVHTLRTGGDVVHYLVTKTENMFRDLAAKLRTFGERSATLLESYIALVIISTMGLSIVYMVSTAFQSYWQGGFSSENFLLYSYILIPVISVLFIYLSDLSSFQEPIYETTPYKIFAATMPLTIFLTLVMFFPYLMPGTVLLPFTHEFMNFLKVLRGILGLEQGFEPALGLGVALIVGTLPAAVAHSYYNRRRGRGIINEVTNFLRDLTEARKTGASPESCIIQLSTRSAKPYGSFSEHLRTAARQIRWGQPIRVVYETLKKKISSWFALINLYLLVDATDVGGGSPETLETLARFGEMQSSLEKEKMAALRPLMMMPYIGTAILVFATVVTVGFMRSAIFSISHQTIQSTRLFTIILPALVFQSYLTGIVAGKISTGTASAGFRHAIILTVIALMLIVMTPLLKTTIPW